MAWMITRDESTYLAHHGIKGQKWGVRRFQNPDGSYTSAGKERYGKYKNLNLKDFKNTHGELEYINHKTGEFCYVADTERLKYKFGVSETEAINRINKVRNDQDTIDKAKKGCMDDLNKYGPKFGKEYASNLKYTGICLNRDNDIELLFDVCDNKNDKIVYGFSTAYLDENDKKATFFEYND